MLQEEHVASGDNLSCYLIEHDKSLFTVLTPGSSLVRMEEEVQFRMLRGNN